MKSSVINVHIKGTGMRSVITSNNLDDSII